MGRFKLDDPLDAVAVHGGGGVVGVLLLPFFAYGEGIFWIGDQPDPWILLGVNLACLIMCHKARQIFLHICGSNIVLIFFPCSYWICRLSMFCYITTPIFSFLVYPQKVEIIQATKDDNGMYSSPKYDANQTG